MFSQTVNVGPLMSPLLAGALRAPFASERDLLKIHTFLVYADFSWVPPGSCCTLVSLIVLILSAILGLHRMTRARSPIHVHKTADDEVAVARVCVTCGWLLFLLARRNMCSACDRLGSFPGPSASDYMKQVLRKYTFTTALNTPTSAHGVM